MPEECKCDRKPDSVMFLATWIGVLIWYKSNDCPGTLFGGEIALLGAVYMVDKVYICYFVFLYLHWSIIFLSVITDVMC